MSLIPKGSAQNLTEMIQITFFSPRLCFEDMAPQFREPTVVTSPI